MKDKAGSWVLTDTKSRIWVDSIELGADELGMAGASVSKKTLRGGLCDGVDLIEVNNGAFSFSILPTRGMGIWRGEYNGIPVGWQAPVSGPVHPGYVDLEERGGLGWLGGFDECLVRCGLAYNGPPVLDVVQDNMGNPSETQLTLHGRIANVPAHYVEVRVVAGDPPEIVVIGSVDESMLFYPSLRLDTRISTKHGSNALVVNDQVTNMRSVESEMQILYHCNFSSPFMEEGSSVLLPHSAVIPRNDHAAKDVSTWSGYRGPTTGFVEQCYFCIPLGDAAGNSLALLRNSEGSKGVAVRFNVKELSCFTLWKNNAAECDGYVTGLEPGTNYPNTKPFERGHGRLVNLGPGDKYSTCVTFEVHDAETGVNGAVREIEAIQGDGQPTVSDQPDPDYCES
jgi:hypothetical protein